MPIHSTIRSAWRAACTEFGESSLGQKFHLGLKTAAAAGIAGLMALGPASVRIPMKPAGYSDLKAATHSDLKAATVPI